MANFIILVLALIFTDIPGGLNWIWSLFPSLSVQQGIYLLMKHTGLSKMSFGEYWKDKDAQPFFIMQWIEFW